ncbi:MAG: diacylglycerol kinase family protein [Bacteroidota bacterium]
MLKDRVNSFKYAFAGIGRLFNTQPNARVHVLAVGIVVTAGFYFEISSTEWCCCILAMATVLAAEAFNTALEDLTDLVSPDHHPLAGHTKDLAAAGVLLTAIGAALVGGVIFGPKIFDLVL